MKALFALALAIVMLLPVAGQADAPPDPALFSYQQRNGAQLPLAARFRDQRGDGVTFGDLARGKPIILLLGYFHCTTLCGIARDDLFRALASQDVHAGSDYALVVLSIDPSESSEDARAAEAQDVEAYGLEANEPFRRYLTGDARDIQQVADAVGFRNKIDPETKQFVHPAGVVFATRAGVVSSYVLGVGYSGEAVRAGLNRAAANTIARAASPVLLLCFHFDPSTGRYTPDIVKLLRLLSIATVAATLIALICHHRGWRRA